MYKQSRISNFSCSILSEKGKIKWYRKGVINSVNLEEILRMEKKPDIPRAESDREAHSYIFVL